MTIRTLINKVKEENPNSFTDEKLVSFVNEIEHDVAEELKTPFETEYTKENDMDTVLMTEPPYDRLYVSYVKAQIDYANQEMESYQNNAMQHVQDFRDFRDWVVRTNQALEKSMPRRVRNIM